MSSVTKWNVRIIDYLLERGVDPNTEDKFGFTAKRKADFKQLRTIYSMLDSYEQKDNSKASNAKNKSALTNEGWAKKLDSKQDLTGFQRFKVWP